MRLVWLLAFPLSFFCACRGENVARVMPIEAERLLELRKLELDDPRVVKFIRDFNLVKVEEARIRSFAPRKTESSTERYSSFDFPLEILFKRTKYLDVSVAVEERSAFKYARVGFIHNPDLRRRVAYYMTSVKGLKGNQIVDLFSSLDTVQRWLPYGLKIGDSPEDVWNKLGREESSQDNAEGLGYMDYYGGPPSSYSLKVFFMRRRLCGVDIYGADPFE